MKVVLFCGGLGTRIRDYSETIPKPMIPVGQQPILWHVMQYYSQYGHRDFVLCLGYKANVFKEFFLTWRQSTYSDCVISNSGVVEYLGKGLDDWRVTLVDTGMWRNIGQRLLAVRDHLKDEEVFLANYSDGLSDAPLPQMMETLRESGKVGCFLVVRPPLTFHLVEFHDRGGCKAPPRKRGRRHLGQWRLFCLHEKDIRLHQGRRGARDRAVSAPDRCRPAHRIPPRRFFPGYGHSQGQANLGGHGRARPYALAGKNGRTGRLQLTVRRCESLPRTRGTENACAIAAHASARCAIRRGLLEDFISSVARNCRCGVAQNSVRLRTRAMRPPNDIMDTHASHHASRRCRPVAAFTSLIAAVSVNRCRAGVAPAPACPTSCANRRSR